MAGSALSEWTAANVEVLLAAPEDRQTAAAWEEAYRIPFTVLTGHSDAPTQGSA
ncbi:hypothetical protein GCM10027168_63460 [Streptomyces capparidis]